jgi:hypothetical protein
VPPPYSVGNEQDRVAARNKRDCVCVCNEQDQCQPVTAFPHPGLSKEQDGCFVVQDRNGHALSYVYFKDEPGPGSVAKFFTRMKHGKWGQFGKAAGVIESRSP